MLTRLAYKQVFVFLFILMTSFSFSKTQSANIICIGDSITEGGALNNPATEATPLLVEQMLGAEKKELAIRVANLGFSGHTTVDFLPASQTDFPKVLEKANAFAQDRAAMLLFSIMLGTNDSANSGTNGSPVSAADYKQNLKTIIDALLKQFPNAKFVVQFPTWYSPNTHNGASYLQEGLTRLHSYFPQIDQLVKEYQVSRPHQVFAGDKSSFTLFKKDYKHLFKPEPGKDGVFYLHPNALGSKELAKIWIQGMLKAL